MKSTLDQVREFHVAAGESVPAEPTAPSLSDEMGFALMVAAGRLRELVTLLKAEPLLQGSALLRGCLMLEELSEFLAAMAREDVVQIARELADLKYVTDGTAVEFGIPLDRVSAEVHRTNMAKVSGGVLRDVTGKILKPEGWTPPDIEAALRGGLEQGWCPLCGYEEPGEVSVGEEPMRPRRTWALRDLSTTREWGFSREAARGIQWVIVGGESGPKARWSNPDWFRSLRDRRTGQRGRAGLPAPGAGQAPRAGSDAPRGRRHRGARRVLRVVPMRSPRKTDRTAEDCAPPVWANLFFVRGTRTLWNGTVGFHGLPRVGDFIDHGEHYGTVTGIRFGEATDGSFKATVFVEAEEPAW